jgi:putative tricarboxylic transport membrane protein
MNADIIVEAFFLVFSWPTLGWIGVGVLIGIFFGALPGVGSGLGMVIALPLTIPLTGLDALVLLIAIYGGAMYSGSIPAILMNVPGSAGSAAVTFDGYPMSRQGKALDALIISICASAIGGAISFIVLILSASYIVEIVMAFGSPEVFLVAFMGIALISVVSQGAFLKGIMAGAFGFFITTIGISGITGERRFTFDSLILFNGLDFIAILIGLFALSEMLKLTGEAGGIAKSDPKVEGSVIEGVKTVFRHPVTLLKSSLIGIVIGAIPGSGASVSNFLAYGEAVRSSNTPERFGNGAEEGIIAADAANNGTVGGALIPAIAFGIPGSGSIAILIGGLLLHGMQPGPSMFNEDILITYSLYFGLLASSVVILLAGYVLITPSYKVTLIDTDLIVPLVIVVAVFGAFTVRANWIDLITLFLIGTIGYFIFKYDYSIISFILGVVLGPIVEDNLIRSLMLHEWSIISVITNSYLAIILTALIVLLVFAPQISIIINKLRG